MNGLNLITYTNLNEHQHLIAHFCSTRVGGVSRDAYASLNLGLFTDDEPENIVENRSRLCQELGIPLAGLHNAHQTHGKKVKVIDQAFLRLPLDKRQAELEGFDALITNIARQCVTVTTADCVPILLYDKENQVVAAVHSGWRGTLENICAETVAVMQTRFRTKPQQLVAAIGACISQPKYEVGQELYTLFAQRGFNTEALFIQTSTEKYLFNVREAVLQQLKALGISNIEVSPYCTYSDADLFFSARRLGNDSGRLLSGIFLK
jgi:YfiH family protein